MQKRRRVSDSVLGGVLPALGLRKQSSLLSTRGEHLASASTLTSPLPWAVINFDIFWVLLSPNSQCGERLAKTCGVRPGGCGSHNHRQGSLLGGPHVCPEAHTCQALPPGGSHACQALPPGGSHTCQALPPGGSHTCQALPPGGSHTCQALPPGGSHTCQALPPGGSHTCQALPPGGSHTCQALPPGGSHTCQALPPGGSHTCQALPPGGSHTCQALPPGGSHTCQALPPGGSHTCQALPPGGSHTCQALPPGGSHTYHCSPASAGWSLSTADSSPALSAGQQEDPTTRRKFGVLHSRCDASASPTPSTGECGDDKVSQNNVGNDLWPVQGSCCCCCCCCSTMCQVQAIKEEARQLRAGEVAHREGSQVKGATMRVAGEGFSAHKSAISEQQQRHTKTPAGTINQESSRQAAKSGLIIKTKGVCTKQSSSMTASQSNVHITGFEDLDNLSASSQPVDIQNAIMRYSGVMSSFVDQLKSLTVNECLKDAPSLLENIDDMMRKAWSVPIYGHELGFSLCNVLRNNGGMDILLDNCRSDDSNVKFSSAKVLEQCLTTENRGYVVEKGLENVVNVACDCTKNGTSVDKSRVGTGILEHLFKHSEGTCSDIIQLGGLDAVLSECRKSDVETLRHCAGALANLSLYGGSDNQQAMIQRKVPMWLFPLAFHSDDNIKYYACLAIATLVANKELEAAVLQSGTLNLVEPFVLNQIPDQFANSTVAHRHGQSQSWLQRLLPVLRSKREEARNLAAFHFCMEAGIKKQQGNIELFREIGAVEPLKEVASSPNAIASKYAVQALRLIGEEVPHKLSQQVPLWTPEDVKEWVKQIGFSQHGEDFVSSRVDGDLLLQLTEENLREDIGIKNGILRQRFLRELRKLKLLADYSSCDSTRLNEFMVEIDKEFAEYTYRMLRAGVTRDCLRYLSEEQLITECGIYNSIHRQRIRDTILNDSGQLQDANSLDKTLDVFISYRRSNGSQLASLLKVHMQLKEFSVFIDVERLEAGKFDNNLLNSIRQAKNFLLVLTPNALDRCIGDTECKDWVHREIVAALQSGCNIIPIIDNFQWPDPEELPEDMRAVCYFNGVRWIHDYQDACVDKMERFMRGECNVRGDGPLGRYVSRSVEGGMATPGTPSTLPRAPPLYQRTTSTESGKGSSCSDKDPKD
ncbi:NAD(+) hydrolase sarm1 isoform X7 [Procambarus clarkii]|uniref:NAD(+) hydrolase sarm1 isoform X7 n=1 Tax=Procambarus clarkii TaxID=6728 RepID=UPI003743CF35